MVECGVALDSAWRAHSPALLAFGSDSLIELLSASVVLLQFAPSVKLSPRRAARWAGGLLVLLGLAVIGTSVGSLVYGIQAQVSDSGIAITLAALVIMPILGWAKRRASRKIGNAALAADAVQSATCAYLAAITLAGLVVNAVFHIGWVDSIAALLAVPLLYVEGRRTWRGEECGCC